MINTKIRETEAIIKLKQSNKEQYEEEVRRA